MRRTTILLDDALYDRLKELSKKRGSTLKEILNNLLRSALASLGAKKTAVRVTIPLHKKNGARPGIDISDRNALYDFMEL